MLTVVATRSELLARRRQARFAEQGRDLLKDKRTALIGEFQRHSADLLAGLNRLRLLSASARARLDEARAECGTAAVASAAQSAETGVAVSLHLRVIAGVTVVDLAHGPLVRTPAERGWSKLLTPLRIDDTARGYEDLLEHLLDLGAMELSVRRLAAEIARCTRQINALDNVLLPRLDAEARFITRTLDEREREEHARLRRARERRARPERPAGEPMPGGAR